MISSLINKYISITENCPIGELGAPFTFYYADKANSNILANNVIEIDIVKAGPTMCRILFGNTPFVQKLFEIEDKKERSKMISTTIKEWDEKYNTNYTTELNILNKISVIGYVYALFEDIHILEYVKDGIIFSGIKTKPNKLKKDFVNCLQSCSVDFHEDNIKTYMRFNKTTIIKYKNDLKIKGIYNSAPEFICDIINKLCNGEIYNNELLFKIKHIYSNKFYQVLKESNLVDLINYYYSFTNSSSPKYLDFDNSFIGSRYKINPKNYLFNIVYPILTLLRINTKDT